MESPVRLSLLVLGKEQTWQSFDVQCLGSNESSSTQLWTTSYYTHMLSRRLLFFGQCVLACKSHQTHKSDTRNISTMMSVGFMHNHASTYFVHFVWCSCCLCLVLRCQLFSSLKRLKQLLWQQNLAPNWMDWRSFNISLWKHILIHLLVLSWTFNCMSTANEFHSDNQEKHYFSALVLCCSDRANRGNFSICSYQFIIWLRCKIWTTYSCYVTVVCEESKLSLSDRFLFHLSFFVFKM